MSLMNDKSLITSLLYFHQVTATLRNLADLSNVRDLFIKNDIIQNILKLLEFLWQDADYALNVSRILR